MGEAKVRGAQPLSASADRALVTKADMDSVKVWCDQVRSDVIELCDDAEVKYLQKCRELTEATAALLEQTLRDEIQAVRGALDDYRKDDLLYRNNVSVRGRLRRLKWWLLAVLPFGIGACNGGQSVPNSQLTVSIDSAHHVACYQLATGSAPLACVRVDSVQVWRASDSSWVLR